MKKEINIQYMTVRLIILIMALFMLSIGVRMFSREFLVGRLDSNNLILKVVFFDSESLSTQEDASLEKVDRFAETVDVDWLSLYPYKEVDNEVIIPQEKVIELGFVNKINERVYILENKVTEFTTHHLVGYRFFVEQANAYKKLVGWNINPPDEYNPVIFVDEDYLGRTYQVIDSTSQVERITSLKDFAESTGKAFLFVQPPAKICKNDAVSNVIDFSNSNIDNLLLGIANNDVEYLDLREELHEDGRNHHKSFFATDHHWTPETGLWAAGKVAEKLNEKLGYSISDELFNENSYNKEIYEDNFLGSQGSKTSLATIGPDDISFLFPKKNVNYTLDIPTIGLSKTGGFDIIYNFAELEEENLYNRNSYAAYMYGLRAMSTIKNNNINDGSKILIISDSFNLAVAPFLAQGVGQVDSALLDYFDGSIYSLIEQNDYDAVIMMYSEMSEFSEGEAFNTRFNFR